MAELVAVRVTEDDLSKGSSTTGVVDDVLHDTTDVSMALAVVEGSEFGGVLLGNCVSISVLYRIVRDWREYRADLSQPGVGGCSRC